MKLRISGSSLRFRLSQTEAAKLSQGCAISHEVSFAPQVSLKLMLIPSEQAGALFNEKNIVIKIARKDCDVDSIGVAYEFENGTAEKLNVMIEKDDPSRCVKTL